MFPQSHNHAPKVKIRHLLVDLFFLSRFFPPFHWFGSSATGWRWKTRRWRSLLSTAHAYYVLLLFPLVVTCVFSESGEQPGPAAHTCNALTCPLLFFRAYCHRWKLRVRSTRWQEKILGLCLDPHSFASETRWRTSPSFLWLRSWSLGFSSGLPQQQQQQQRRRRRRVRPMLR
jgi:hypothetical protein